MVADPSFNRWKNSNLHNLFQNATFDERKRRTRQRSRQTKQPFSVFFCWIAFQVLPIWRQVNEWSVDGWLVSVVKLSNWVFVSAVFCQASGFWIVLQSLGSNQRGKCIVNALVYKTVTAVGLCCFKHLRSFHRNVLMTNLKTITIIESIDLSIYAP